MDENLYCANVTRDGIPEPMRDPFAYWVTFFVFRKQALLAGWYFILIFLSGTYLEISAGKFQHK